MAVDKSMKILVVDDYNTMRRIIGNLLKQLGFENIDEAADGTEALKTLEENGPHGLIISDWNMEPMTGLQLLKEVRENDQLGKPHLSWLPQRANLKTLLLLKKLVYQIIS